jgi:glycosyltransferase involved in cell wall biosynthesis
MKISFCTTIRNRLHHLRQTLPANLEQIHHHDAELVLLDYGSSDGLDEWLTTRFKDELATGKLRRFRYTGADYFDRCHSKNLAIKLCSGEVFCNIDADNFIGEGFCAYVESIFTSEDKVFITGLNNAPNIPDCFGKICVKIADMFDIGGYDEGFEGHGFEDVDIVNRLQLAGLKKIIISHPAFLRAIPHANLERIKEDKISIMTHRLLVAKWKKTGLHILLFMNNDRYLSCKVVESMFASYECGGFRYKLEPNTTSIGTWSESGKTITTSDHRRFVYQSSSNADAQVYVCKGRLFQEVSGEERPDMILFLTQMINRYRAVDNFKQRLIRRNESFGAGTVVHLETSTLIAI